MGVMRKLVTEEKSNQVNDLPDKRGALRLEMQVRLL